MRSICIGAALIAITFSLQAEVTYNGIVLPPEWPPRIGKLSMEPSLPPYLASPPEVIPIDVGRQLFVDDFLIESTTMTREYHLAQYHADNPVLTADRPWENTGQGERKGPMAMPFSGGVWYDPGESLFKMWYMADYGQRHLCYATSKDGAHWDKPALDVVEGTNIVFPNAYGASLVWLDLEERDPARRFKFVLSLADPEAAGPEWRGALCTMRAHFSPDGIHWGKEVSKTGPCGDRNSAFYNPFRKKWVFSIRHYGPVMEGIGQSVRCRKYWESPDLVQNALWNAEEPYLWVGADKLDPSRTNIVTELYNLDAVAYESVLLGLFAIQRAVADVPAGRPKINEVCVGFSRDGFHWFRPDRHSFLPVSDDPQDWNWGNVQPIGGGCIVTPDELRFYVSGRRGDAPGFHDAGGSTGMATLRRDGFASMNAGAELARLDTRVVTFNGNRLFVNVDAAEGELRAELLDADGNAIPPFTESACIPIRENTTKSELRWTGASDLSPLAGKPARLRFHLRNGKLYSFWVTASPTGASHGYVAAGGPAYTAAVDQ